MYNCACVCVIVRVRAHTYMYVCVSLHPVSGYRTQIPASFVDVKHGVVAHIIPHPGRTTTAGPHGGAASVFFKAEFYLCLSKPPLALTPALSALMDVPWLVECPALPPPPGT